MIPFYLQVGTHSVAAIYQAASGASMDTAVLIVPPFGWDDQTSYRPRRDWSLALADAGFANLRIDLPGSGDSSGRARDEGLLDAWTCAVAGGVEWLREAGARRVAVISLGLGGLMALRAVARGTAIDDIVLWGVPATGRGLVREIKAFGRLEQSQTGEPPEDAPEGELRAGGHVIAPATLAELSAIDVASLISAAAPTRALVLGRDGTRPDRSLVDSLRAAGADVRSDPGNGWGAAIDRPQSTSPTAAFAIVNAWLAEFAKAGPPPREPEGDSFVELGSPGARIRETPIVFEGAGQQIYAVVAEPLDAPVAAGTVILFNAGAIRRIGPNRMWTEAARRWAANGVPVIRLDVEGIGDAGGDNSAYQQGDESFYISRLTEQARAALDLAIERGLPDRFLLAGLCSGAYWAFETAVADPRVQCIVMLNPRLLIFDANAEGSRELRKLGRLLTRSGLSNLLREKRKLRRLRRFAAYLLEAPRRLLHRSQGEQSDRVLESFRILHARGQRTDIAFSGDEPLHDELQRQGWVAGMEAMGVRFHQIPYKSHTLKPVKAQEAASSILDAVVERTFPRMPQMQLRRAKAGQRR